MNVIKAESPRGRRTLGVTNGRGLAEAGSGQ